MRSPDEYAARAEQLMEAAGVVEGDERTLAMGQAWVFATLAVASASRDREELIADRIDALRGR